METNFELSAKKTNIRNKAIDMLQESYEAQVKLVEKALDSGAVNISDWDENHNPMLLPRAIVQAILEHEADQFNAKGTGFEKSQKKEVRNIGLFL